MLKIQIKKLRYGLITIAVFIILLFFLSALRGSNSIFVKEVTFNTTQQVQERIVVQEPGRSGLLITESDSDRPVPPSDSKLLIRNETVTVTKNVSLLSYWLGNWE